MHNLHTRNLSYACELISFFFFSFVRLCVVKRCNSPYDKPKTSKMHSCRKRCNSDELSIRMFDRGISHSPPSLIDDLTMRELARVTMLPTSQQLAALSLAQLPMLYQQHYQLLQLFRNSPYLQQSVDLQSVKQKYQNVSLAEL